MRYLAFALLALLLLANTAMAEENISKPAAGFDGALIPGSAGTAANNAAGADSAAKPATACTQMWCQEGTTINLNGNDWPAGEYYFAIKLDGKMTRCKGTLPFKSCDANVTCNSKDVTIGESGCALPPSAHAFSSITSPLTPAEIGVAIQRADGQFFGWQSAAQKICTYPNGLKCDARECCSVYAELDVVWEKQ